MNWRTYRWSLVAFTLLVTVALLFGGYFLWRHVSINQPISQVVQGIDGIESAALEQNSKHNSIVKIHVTLNNVANLQATYQTLNERIFNVLGHTNYQIILHSSPTPELEHLYYSIHHHIYEAIVTGNFNSMVAHIQTQAAADAISARTFIDGKRVYLQLSNAAGNLYIVIPRQATEVR